MSDTTETETDTNTDNTDEPSKAELHHRVEKLESTVAKMMPSRRDALKLGAAGIAGAAGLSATSQSAEASTGSAGQIGDPNNRPDLFADTVDTNQLTGVSTGADRQGCRVFLSNDQSIPVSTTTKIEFDSKAYDSGNNFDTSTHNWTCPKDGLYAVNVQVAFEGASDGVDRRVVIATGTNSFPANEGAQLRDDKTNQGTRMSVSTINKYSSGDTIAGYARNVGSTGVLEDGSNVNNSFMEVAFLGGL